MHGMYVSRQQDPLSPPVAAITYAGSFATDISAKPVSWTLRSWTVSTA